MKKTKQSNLQEDVQNCLKDPINSILKNFSLEKSKEYYSKWDEAWENWMYSNNPAAQKEKEEFNYKGLEELTKATEIAYAFYNNIKDMPHCKNVRYELSNDKITVHRMRLKTFDEWLHDWLRDAIITACDCPEDWARQVIEKELGAGIYTNTEVHMFAEWVIDTETLSRLSKFEKYQPIEKWDIEEKVEQAKKALEDIKENNVIVLTLKK